MITIIFHLVKNFRHRTDLRKEVLPGRYIPAGPEQAALVLAGRWLLVVYGQEAPVVEFHTGRASQVAVGAVVAQDVVVPFFSEGFLELLQHRDSGRARQTLGEYHFDTLVDGEGPAGRYSAWDRKAERKGRHP